MLTKMGWLDWAWLFVWGSLSTAWCCSAGYTLGPTFDEPFYIQAGLKNWYALNHRELLAQGTMPLPAELQTLPLRLAETWLGVDASADWLDWLPTARLGTLAFWWLLLLSSLRLGTLYGGVAAGRLALALTACEPILLGHASLATADIAFTACLLALMVSFRSRRDLPDWKGRLLVPAFWCMLTFMTKASALLFVPVSLGIIELVRTRFAAWRASLRDLAAIGLLGIVMLFAVCPRASRGLLFQIRHNMDGHGASYLFEQLSPTGFWYYFPAALAVKLGLPVLILLIAACGVAFVKRVATPQAAGNGPLWVALGLLALTPSFKVQIGVRFVLPIAALAIVGAAVPFARWWNEQTGLRRALGSTFTCLLVVWSATNACLVWPLGICFTNELFGGTSRGYLALTDSNYDWGQGVPDLLAWQRDHADAPLYVWGFGTDPRLLRAPLHPVSPGDLSQGDDVERLCAGGYLAVSTSTMFGYHFNTPAARYLRERIPCGRTMTYLIYDLQK